MSALLDELRFALRSLRKAPVLSFVAVLTLGLGIGMNALMFSLVYGALFRGLPFPEEDRIVRVTWIDPSTPEEGLPGALLAIMLSYHVWMGTFGGDPGVLGQTVKVNGEQATVVSGLTASFLQARRATRVDPVEALRSE